MRFKPAKSRSMVLRKGKVVDKFRFTIADTAIPSISEKPVKSLGKVFDCSLRDTTSIQSTCTELDGWLKSVDKKEVEAVPEVEAEVEAVPEVEAEVEAVPEVEAEVEAVPEAEAEVEAVPEVEAEVEAVPEVEAEVEAVPEVEAEVEVEEEEDLKQEENLIPATVVDHVVNHRLTLREAKTKSSDKS
ncbi:hypothetical protein NHX12_005869 [Muraenolepis orangiensis]|uniref:Uncharacterized protein n=1 Tax=Muraenolepis orangiensis TaxID=630683 RepID=A0A9Q0DRG3_9TELE|nr:hypothetical protein NHX12_005869 [Muraenolepis orangiensis]